MAGGAGAGTVIFTPTNPKVTQTVSGAAVARELRVFTHLGFFNIDKAEYRHQFGATQIKYINWYIWQIQLNGFKE